MTRKILVTGGAGFVGRHLVESLAGEADNEIWIIDNLSTGRPPPDWDWPKIENWRVDASSSASFSIVGKSARVVFMQADLLQVLLAELGRIPMLNLGRLPAFEEVYHLASVVGGRNTIENDPLAVGIDLAIDSIFFLWAAHVSRPGRILYASSSAAYPIDLQESGRAVALEEGMIDFGGNLGKPDLTYGWSKLTGEYLARIAVDKYGLSVATVRPFSGYGEDQDTTYPFPAIALRVAARHDPVNVWGDGRQSRDFVHIDDAVRACVLACRSISDGTAINIGHGIPVSMSDLAARMIAIEGYAATVRAKLDRPVGVSSRFCDPRSMKLRLGWTPEILLDEGIRRCLVVARRRLAAGVHPPD